MKLNQKNVEVCFSPALFTCYHNRDAIVVVVDILRATSAICAAFMNGVKAVIPVGTVDEAKEYKKNGYMVAAERDGLVLDFADFGNSPFNFTTDRVQGQIIAYSTTNGTQAIQMSSDCYKVTVGAYLNISSLAQWLIDQNRDVVILCAGWKNRFSLEDSVFAGLLAERLLEHPTYTTICDSTFAAIDLWSSARHNLRGYIEKAAQRSRLRVNGLDDVIDFCHTPDLTNLVPVFTDGKLVSITVPVQV